MMQRQIEKKIIAKIDLIYLKVINESYKHNVMEPFESHFKIILVSNQFHDKKTINRHRMIYNILTNELNGQIHAISLHTYTAKEWQLLQNMIPASPLCSKKQSNYLQNN